MTPPPIWNFVENSYILVVPYVPKESHIMRMEILKAFDPNWAPEKFAPGNSKHILEYTYRVSLTIVTFLIFVLFLF